MLMRLNETMQRNQCRDSDQQGPDEDQGRFAAGYQESDNPWPWTERTILVDEIKEGKEAET